jgi:hypothetical protein
MARLSRLLALLACLPLFACFEEPYREHLHLWLLPGGEVVVTATQEVAKPEETADNPKLELRLEEARSGMERGWDRWSQRFAAVRPEAERRTLSKVAGVVRRLTLSALLEGPGEGERFLSECGFSAVFSSGEGSEELALYPTGPGSATARQQELMDRRLERWAGDVFEYLRAAGELYALLEERPERAAACFAHVFDEGEEGEPLEASEEPLIERLSNAIDQVAAVLLVTEGEAFSLNQLSRLVYDPFPARLTVRAAGSPLEVEGLVEHEGFFERQPVSLWSSLAGIEGRWLTPDIVTAMAVPGGLEVQPERDPIAFAAIERFSSPPQDSGEIVAAIRGGLVPEAVCRVRWQTTGSALPGGPLDLLSAAEAALPE